MKIFVSHGHDGLAKLKIKDFLSSQVGHVPVILGQEAGRHGLTIIEALERFSEGCEFAVILLTADDVTTDGGRRARQNVIHKIGFFQGRLGRTRVVLVVQSGVEIPSNLAGMFYLAYEHEIEQIFGDLRVILDSGNASSSATELGREDRKYLTEKYDRIFPKVQDFLGEIIAFKLKSHEVT
jgi:predicted nucleotide-binding protein